MGRAGSVEAAGYLPAVKRSQRAGKPGYAASTLAEGAAEGLPGSEPVPNGRTRCPVRKTSMTVTRALAMPAYPESRIESGSVTVNVAPNPGSLSTSMAPSWASTTRLAIQRPNPRPP